jgi:hypothetical protein
MIDEGHGWAVGDNGTILRFGANTAVDEFNVQGSRFKVEVYPNPTRGISDFSINISQYQYVSLKIFDLHGREVMQVLDAEMTAGEHEVEVDMTGLPEGVYFVQLAVGNRQLAVGKVALVR